MASAQSYSYLDLSVHNDLAPFVLSGDATVLFANGLDAILWANAAGAKLFGGRGVAALLEASLTENHAFVRQLHAAVSQIEEGRPLVRGFRISTGLRATLLQFEIKPLRFADGNTCYRVTEKKAGRPSKSADDGFATDAVESLEGFADAAAIVDDFGLPLASSAEFENIGPPENALADLITELKSEEDRLIKREVTSSSGKTVAAGLGRLSDDPGRNLIVLARADAEQAPGPAPDQETAAAEPGEEAGERFEESRSTATPQQEPVIDETVTDLDETVTGEPDDADTPSTIDDQEDDGSLDEAGELAEETSGPEAEARPDAPPQTPSETAEGHLRFAWVTDASAVFTEVSPELAQAVGPPAAEITGRRWRDVASGFGFDEKSEIASLLERRDTWSGKTVLWPVAGTDMVVPVDLAALPVFDSERNFAGFRGFGIIRTVDAVVDVDAGGLELEEAVSAPAGDEDQAGPDGQAEGDGELWFELEPDGNEPEIRLHPDMRGDSGSEDAEPTNVVQIRPGMDHGQNDRLSSTESEAFEKIGSRLKTKFVQGPASREKQPADKRKPDTSLIEQLPVAVLVYRSGETLFANERFLEASGYESLEELAEAGGMDAIFEPGFSGEETPEKGYQLVRRDGTTLPVSPVLNTVPWDGQKALQLSFAPPSPATQVPDVLELTRASEIQSILDVTSDGIVLLQDDGEIVSINASAEALFNRSFDDAAGQHFADLFTEESRTEINRYISGLATPGIEGLLQEGREVIAEESNGGMIPVLLTIAPLKSSGKLCAVIRDMTSWKQTEQELIKARRNAERSSDQKSDFLAQVSHEVRIPLTAIIGFSDIMIEERFGPINNERYREYLRDIKRSGQHVLDLINDLLDLSKIEAGKLDLKFEATDLNGIVTETVAMLQPHANSNRIIIRTSLSRSVPKVVADTRSIRQVILNLVTNAIKFSPANSQVIVSTVYESNGEVALRVRDTGSGMSESEIEEAMKPYSQLGNIAEKSGKGTGLGLPLTKALVEANRAYFDLESEPGKGTIAHVQFPIQRVLAD